MIRTRFGSVFFASGCGKIAAAELATRTRFACSGPGKKFRFVFPSSATLQSHDYQLNLNRAAARCEGRRWQRLLHADTSYLRSSPAISQMDAIAADAAAAFAATRKRC